MLFIEKDHRLEVRLPRLGLSVARKTLISNDSNDRVAADNRASQIGDLNTGLPGPTLLGDQRCCCRQCSKKPSSCPSSHEFPFETSFYIDTPVKDRAEHIALVLSKVEFLNVLIPERPGAAGPSCPSCPPFHGIAS